LPAKNGKIRIFSYKVYIELQLGNIKNKQPLKNLEDAKKKAKDVIVEMNPKLERKKKQKNLKLKTMLGELKKSKKL